MELHFDGKKDIRYQDILVIKSNTVSHCKDENVCTIYDTFIFWDDGNIRLVYDKTIDENVDNIPPVVTVYLADISRGYDHHIHILKTIKAMYVVPFPNVSQQQAINFCREVMMKHVGIPKYFVSGQSLIIHSS